MLRLSQKWGALSLSKPFNNNSGPKSPLKPGTLRVRPFLVGGECRKSRDNQNTREGDDAGTQREKNCNNIVRFYHCETEQNGQTRREKKRTGGSGGTGEK